MDYLRRFAIWFVSGLGLAAGVTLVVTGYDYWRPWKVEVLDSNVPIEQIALSNTEISPVTNFLTVVGTITNNTSRDLETIRVRVELLQGEKVLFECSESLRSLPAPGKTGHLQVECREVERDRIPAGVRQRVRVWYVEAR